MALSYKDYIADGQTKDFPIPFKSLHNDDIKVYVDGKLQDRTVNNKVVSLLAPPVANVVVRVKRETPLHERVVDFDDGAILSEKVLDQANEQLFFVAQEVLDYSEGLMKLRDSGHFSAENRRIRNVANPVENNDAVNLSFMKEKYIPAARGEADRAKSEREETEQLKAATKALKIDTEQVFSESRTVINTIKDHTENIRVKAQQHMETAYAHKEKAIAEADKATSSANRAQGEADRAKGYVEQYKPEVKGSWVFSNYRNYADDGQGAGGACIYNDKGQYNCLLIQGNNNGNSSVYRIGLFTHVTVHGELYVKKNPVYHRGNITISNKAPSGGADGHIWFKYS